MKYLPRWTAHDEALHAINRALIELISEGEYDLVTQLATVAKGTRDRVDERRRAN